VVGTAARLTRRRRTRTINPYVENEATMSATLQDPPSTTRTSVPTARGRLPLVGHAPALIRRPLKFLQSMPAQGDAVRIYIGRSPIYVLNSPALVHRLLVTQVADFHKGRIYDKAGQYLGNGLAMSDGETHKRHRRLMQPAFHHERIAEYSKTMSDLATARADSWTAGQTLDLDEEMNALALWTLGKVLFSSALDDEAAAAIQASLKTIMGGVARSTMTPDFVSSLPTPWNRRIAAAKQRLRRIVGDLTAAYRADGKDHGDLLSMLILAEDASTGEPLTDGEVYDQIMAIALAGGETVGYTLTWLFHELADHPEVERRLQEELRQVLRGRSATIADLPDLQYTSMVVNEVMRLHPPAPIFMRRTVEATDFAGIPLPAHTEVLISLYAMFRDPAVFPDPERFDPDRWRPGNTPYTTPDAFIPYGAGRRKCIGSVFATAQLAITTATIASRWRLVHAPGQPDIRQVPAAIIHPNHMRMVPYPQAAGL
jgi:cytochrome P450